MFDWWPFSLPTFAAYAALPLVQRKDSSARPAEWQSTAGYSTGTTTEIPRPAREHDERYTETAQICSVVYQCLRKVTASVAEPSWIVKVDGKADSNHPLNKLLAKPNLQMSGRKLFESMAGDYFTQGVFSTVRTTSRLNNGSILEIWPVLAKLVKPRVNENGKLVAFVVGDNTTSQIDYPINPLTGDCDLLFSSNYNPKSLWFGLSGFPAAWNSIEQFLGYERFNYAQLNNSSDIAGVVGAADATKPLQINQAKDLLDAISAARGPGQAGKWLVTTGATKVDHFDRSPQEMSFTDGKAATARDIAQTLGVPALLLGLPGDNTFNNYDAARLAFTEDTILPHYLKPIGSELSRWFSAYYGIDISVEPDQDTIAALVKRRIDLMTAINGVQFISIDEKRTWMGFDTVPGGDVILTGAGQIPLDMVGADTVGAGGAAATNLGLNPSDH